MVVLSELLWIKKHTNAYNHIRLQTDKPKCTPTTQDVFQPIPVPYQLHYAHNCTQTKQSKQTNKQKTKKTRLPLNKVHCLILERGGELGEWLQQPSLRKDDQQDTTVSLLQKVQNLWHVFLLTGHFGPFVWFYLFSNIKMTHIYTLSRVHWPLCRSRLKAAQYAQP